MKTKGKSGVMDMTQGNMAMLILSFALPLMLGNVFQQFYTVADTAIVGKILGVDALAALGTVESINWLVLGTIQGITQGFGILVSQQFGAKKEEALQETIFHASFLAVVAAILFTVGILIGLPGLVGILQVPVDIRPICLDYLYVLFGGIPLMMLYNFTAAMLRAFGDSKTPLTACVIAALFNIALDLYFILELGWGVKGAALATVIAQTLASAYCLWKLCRIEVLTEKRKAAKWRLHAGLCGKLIYLGLPMAFQNLVIAIGGMIVQTVVNSFGVAFIAGYTATCKLYGILEVAATSYGFAMVTYTGQNLGAGKTDRIKNRCFDRCADFLCHYRTDVSVRTKYSGTFHLCRCSPGQSGCGGCMALFADYEQLLMGTVYFTYRPQRDPGNGKYRDSACIRNF